MDQDSFRQLLQTPRPGASSTPTARGTLLGQAKKPAAAKKASNEPAFKPRNVKKDKDGEKKKKDARWRDRAAERREGKEGDFADVEAVLKEFEKRNEGEEDMEDKRAYLGGDAEHSVLVRGLDRALLEQNRARLASHTNAEADEDLEATFSSLPAAKPDSAAPKKGADGKKRSRADILADLKAKRDGGVPATPDDAPFPNSKFKPIAASSGFKPIGEKKKKKKRAKEEAANGEDGGKKKKRKMDEGAVEGRNGAGMEKETPGATNEPVSRPPAPEPEPVDEDFDIFADAGEYEGVADSGSDSDEDKPRPPSPPPAAGLPRRGWFDEPEPSPPPTAPSPPPATDKGKGKAPGPDIEEGEMQDDHEEEEQPIRLQPLSSSTVPSIREILAADKAAEKEEARKARKEKKKKGKGELSEEAKINRDLQKMKVLEAKKGK
ncbi:unnamed protein product [Peniophora sp. CBMAI 1063]|nr:unnamed protein product [Peniophora sp. CBMAI 1063]